MSEAVSKFTGRSPSNSLNLPKQHILRGREAFASLFEQAQVMRSPVLSFRYRLLTTPATTLRIGFIAGKKTGKAHERNRLKRLLRESFRHLLPTFRSRIQSRSCSIDGVFIVYSKRTSFTEVYESMKRMLQTIELPNP